MIDSMVVLRSILETTLYFLVISSFKQIHWDKADLVPAWVPRGGLPGLLRHWRRRRCDPVISYLEPLNSVLTRAAPIGMYNGQVIHQAIALENGNCYQFDRINPLNRDSISGTGAFTIQLAGDEYVDGQGIIYRRI